jgi:hypothetical protein
MKEFIKIPASQEKNSAGTACIDIKTKAFAAYSIFARKSYHISPSFLADVKNIFKLNEDVPTTCPARGLDERIRCKFIQNS